MVKLLIWVPQNIDKITSGKANSANGASKAVSISSVPVFGQPPQDRHGGAKVPGDVLPPAVADDQTMEEHLDSLETVAEWGPRIISKSGPGFLSLVGSNLN